MTNTALDRDGIVALGYLLRPRDDLDLILSDDFILDHRRYHEEAFPRLTEALQQGAVLELPDDQGPYAEVVEPSIEIPPKDRVIAGQQYRCSV